VIEFDITLDGDVRVTRGFTELGAKADDLRDPFQEMADSILGGVEEDFVTHGGGRWRPLDEEYRRWKERTFPGRGPLVLTGELRRQLTSRSSVRVGPNLFVYAPQSVEMFKLEDRPIQPRVRNADAILRRWVRRIVRESFGGRER
jgi:hypothetical protein